VLGPHVAQLMRENGDVKIEEMTGMELQEEKLIEMETGVAIGVDGGLMNAIVILRGDHQEELEAKIVGEDLKERKGVLLGETEMVQLGEEEMIADNVMLGVLEEAMTVGLVVGMIVVPVGEMTGVEETIVVRLIGGLLLENLIEMTKAQGTAIAVMIGVIEAMQAVEMTIGGLDREWVTEIVEVRAIAVLQRKINHPVEKTKQMEMTGNGKLSANVN